MVTAGRTLAQVSEASLLAEIFPFFPAREGVLVGPGDDAAVLVSGGSVVVTTDAMVRGRDWLDEWSTAADVATKVFTQNVADVAAMGATPTSLVVTLVADPATPADWAVELARTLGALATDAGVAVAGGDLSSAPSGTVMVSITALGDLRGRAAVLRSGARPGDTVAVHGTLGRSAAGLLLLQQEAGARGETDGARGACVAHHLRPVVDGVAGAAAADGGATAMLDVSDGLLRDGSRIAAASGVRLALDSALLEPDLVVLREAVGDAALESVLAGGEEHSLLATFAGTLGTLPPGWRPLGRVEEGEGVTLDGVAQQPRGWDHFAG